MAAVVVEVLLHQYNGIMIKSSINSNSSSEYNNSSYGGNIFMVS